jgi:hypothetical protein
MKSGDWQHVEEIFHEALQRDPAQRADSSPGLRRPWRSSSLRRSESIRVFMRPSAGNQISPCPRQGRNYRNVTPGTSPKSVFIGNTRYTAPIP